MAEAFRIEVHGLRDLAGRFAQSGAQGLQERQDALVKGLAKEAKERLTEHAPRGHTTPHLADMFQVTSLERDGANATIAVTNEKQVMSKAGKKWSLLRLIITGTPPHEIYGHPWLHFTVEGHEVFTHQVSHPGTDPNDFVTPVVRDLDVQAKLMTTARGVIVDLAGR